MTVPNPGSSEAIKIGCLCPCIDNGHGRGYMGGIVDADGRPLFIYSAACPVHMPTNNTGENDNGRFETESISQGA